MFTRPQGYKRSEGLGHKGYEGPSVLGHKDARAQEYEGTKM